MPRYIDADALKHRIIKKLVLRDDTYLLPGEKAIYEEIDKQPTADVVEVKHGKWIQSVDRWGDIITTVDGYTCSDCGFFDAYEDRYCPNCGAKMDGDGE